MVRRDLLVVVFWLEDRDMCVAPAGTGLVLAQTCGGLGARIVLLNRPSARAEKAQSKLVDLNVDAVSVPCDLQSLESVRKASEELFRQCPSGIDVLCNNAGVMGLPGRNPAQRLTCCGRCSRLCSWCLTFCTNNECFVRQGHEGWL